ncbi:MAG: copper chaperone PCu(A)C [Rhodobacteraceae bacterium]|nr:copper chaperone PCu(A)C [Paracoccaceae bacterium]
MIARRTVFIVLILAAAFGGLALRPTWAQDDDRARVQIVDAWARVALTRSETTAYVTMMNVGGESDRLVGVSSPVAGSAKLEKVGGWGFSMKPREVESVKIGAARVVKLEPGRTYIHLYELTQRLEAGKTLPLSLRFQKSGTLYVEAVISNQELGNRGR